MGGVGFSEGDHARVLGASFVYFYLYARVLSRRPCRSLWREKFRLMQGEAYGFSFADGPYRRLNSDAGSGSIQVC